MERRHYPGKRFVAPARALLAACVFATLSGCGGGAAIRHSPPAARIVFPAVWPSTVPDLPEAANAVLMRALSLVGTPYTYGGNTPETGFDCSGLVDFVFRDAALRSLPRTTSELARSGSGIGLDRLAAGDLVLFGEPGSSHHVGIYVGEGRFVHAPSTGGIVRLDRVDGPYWRDHFQGARRVLR